MSSKKTPAYRHHKASGQAIVTLDGRMLYLGKYGTKASRAEYDRIVGEWLANGRRLPSGLTDRNDITLLEIEAAYMRHAREHYVKNGRPTSEQGNIDRALGPVRDLYGETNAVDFGPLALKTVRQKYIEKGWERRSINRCILRVRQMFKWAAEQELIPASVYHDLRTVSGLQAGRGVALESERVKPVPDESVDAVRPFVSRQVWAMIELQRITGMRSSEVCMMRGIDIDTTGELWLYRPQEHKTEHHGHARVIELGPRAKVIVEEFLKPDLSAYLFSPADALAEHRRELRANRQSKLTPSQRDRKPKENPKRKARVRYDRDSYRRAVARACRLAYPAPKDLSDEAKAQWHREHNWHPHQLRHNAATRIRKEFGLDAARAVLGQRTLQVTEQYAEIDRALAGQVMAKIG